jgi:hypothetical protein
VSSSSTAGPPPPGDLKPRLPSRSQPTATW